MKRIQVFAWAALIMVLGSCEGAGPASQVNVAVNVPLTGPLATYGTSVRDGMLFALEQSPGEPAVAIDFQDNASSPRTARSVAQQQLGRRPDIYVSGVKPQTMAIMDLVEAASIPHFVWIFDAEIRSDSVTRTARTWVNYKAEPTQYLEYARRIGARRVAIAYVLLPHTEFEMTHLVEPGLRSAGVDSVLSVSYDIATEDYRSLALRMQAFQPDLVILNGFQETLVPLVRALRELDAITDGNTIGTYDMLDVATVMRPDELEGIRVVAPAFVVGQPTPAYARWAEAFAARFGRSPLYTDAYAYDLVTLIKAAKLPQGGGTLLDALERVDTVGVTGPLHLGSDGDLDLTLAVGVFRGGTLVVDSVGG